MTRALPALGAVLALALAAPAQAAPAGAKTLTASGVTATLSWAAGSADGIDATAPHLRIERAGTATLDADLARQCRLCGAVYAPQDALSLRDLDGDGEPEVLVDLFSGGAHCCSTTLIWFRRGDGWGRKVAGWGNAGYRLADLDGDGVPELVSADDAFSYAFTAFAYSWSPPFIQRFRAGLLRDATRSFPRRVRADMARIRASLPAVRRSDGDPRGLVAGYAADLCLLGRRADVARYLRHARAKGDLRARPAGDATWPSDGRFAPALRRFLARHGYCA